MGLSASARDIILDVSCHESVEVLARAVDTFREYLAQRDGVLAYNEQLIRLT